jgi:hypothetical protein
VAVLLSLPTGCTLATGGTNTFPIYNQLVSNLFQAQAAETGTDVSSGGVPATADYAIGTWGALLENDGYSKVAGPPGTGEFSDDGMPTGCGQNITDQVRFDASGSSFAFKSYLSQIDFSIWAPYATDYASWPQAVSTTGGLGSNQGGANEALHTADIPGSVGYVNTADAALNGPFTNVVSTIANGGSHQIVWAQVENDGVKPLGSVFSTADPLTSDASPTNELANCIVNTLLPTEKAIVESWGDSYAGVLASSPIINALQPGTYPICTLTYELFWHRYGYANLATAYGANFKNIGNSAWDWASYLTSAAQGQIDIQAHDYTRIPTDGSFDAHVANAVANINFGNH